MDRGSSPTGKAAVMTRRRVVTAEGEEQNPSIGSIEAKYFGEEGHQKQEAQSVNSPAKCDVWSNQVCFSSTLFPVSPRGSAMAKTEYSGGDISAKVDEIQHLFFRSGNEVRSGENSEELRSGDIGNVTCTHREETLYNPIQTALSQSEFQSTTGSRRPTHSTVRPSRFRDDAFETQFQPGGKKKTRKVYLHPGRGDFRGFSAVDKVYNFDQRQQRCLYSGRGDQIQRNKDVSKQTGHPNSSLAEPCSGRRPDLSWRSEPKCRWSTRPKTRFKKCKWSQWKIRFKSRELQYDRASSSKPLLDVIQLAGAQEPTHCGQSCRKQTAQSNNMAGI